MSASREQVVLRVNLLARDASTREVRLQGELDIRPQRYRPPIT